MLYLAVGRQDVTLHHESLTMRFCWAFVIVGSCSFLLCGRVALQGQANRGWAEAHEQISRMTLTIKLDRNWSSFQLANSAPPLSVTDSAIAPSARMNHHEVASVVDDAGCGSRRPMGRCRYAHDLSYMPCLALVCVCVCVCVLPLRVCCPRLCAMPVQHMRVPE